MIVNAGFGVLWNSSISSNQMISIGNFEAKNKKYSKSKVVQ